MAIFLTLQRADTQLFFRVFRQGQRRTLLRTLAKVVSRTGDGYLHVVLALLVVLSGISQREAFIELLSAALVLERLLYFVMKNTLRRRRPQDFVPGFRSIVEASDKFSFPSGHTSGAFCLATTTGIVLGGPFVALYVWAGCVGVSRILLGVHFPGDTIAGGLMGSGIAIVTACQLGLL